MPDVPGTLAEALAALQGQLPRVAKTADACGAQPCRNGDHYGQCWSVTAPYFGTEGSRDNA